jgi:outer membrane lipoprotein-sorting protein
MIRKALLLTLACAALAVPAHAQSLDEVLENYYEAIGGEDAWKAVQSVKMTGTRILGPGVEAPFTMTAKRPDMFRVEFTFQGMTAVMAFDGETAWMIMPFMGSTDPEEMPDFIAETFKEQADIDGALINWEEDGHAVELIGQEDMEGTATHKLKITRNNGNVEFWYLDSEYYIPIKVEGTREVQGQMVDYATTLSDYKEVGGLIMAHAIETSTTGQPVAEVVTIQTVEIGIELDDEQFVMPEKEEGEGQP